MSQRKLSDAGSRIRAASYFLGQTRELLRIRDVEKSVWYLQASIVFTMSAKELLAGKGRIDCDQLEFLRTERNYTLHAGEMEKTYDESNLYFPMRENEDAVTTCDRAIKYLKVLYEKKRAQGF